MEYAAATKSKNLNNCLMNPRYEIKKKLSQSCQQYLIIVIWIQSNQKRCNKNPTYIYTNTEM